MARILCVAAAFAVSLALASSASAGVANSRPLAEPEDICGWDTEISYKETRSERNTVLIVDAQTGDLNPHLIGPGPSPCVTLGGLAILDLESPVLPRGGCFGVTGRDAICSYPVIASPDGHRLVVDVGAMNDSVRIGNVPGIFSVSVQLGSGADNARTVNDRADAVACGPGVDQVIADAADTVAADCEQVVRG